MPNRAFRRLALFSLFVFSIPRPALGGAAPPASVLIVGWDGVRLERLQALLAQGKLPHLQRLAAKGSLLPVRVNTKTDTKAGWAEVITGYDYAVNKVRNNRFYDAIPKGLTLFERARERFGKKIHLIFLAGKGAHLGNRGPHRVCINCVARSANARDLNPWWDETKVLPTNDGKERRLEPRGGEPFFRLAKAADLYRNDLGEGKKVLEAARKAFDAVKGKPFLAFVQFEEPDEPGHQKGERSPEYSAGIEESDRNFGALLEHLGKAGLDKNLRVFVVSDHGFDVEGSGRPDDMEHDTDSARSTFAVTDRPAKRQGGERRDLTPTVLDVLGFDTSKIKPQLEGSSYFR